MAWDIGTGQKNQALKEAPTPRPQLKRACSPWNRSSWGHQALPWGLQWAQVSEEKLRAGGGEPMGEEDTWPALAKAHPCSPTSNALFGGLWNKLCKHSWHFLKKGTYKYLVNSKTQNMSSVSRHSDSHKPPCIVSTETRN